MPRNNIPTVVGLLLGTLCMIVFLVWQVVRSGRLEQRLFDELSEVAELDNELCPFDGSLTRNSTVLLFDFSDHLPASAADYPEILLENMLADLQEAERFDRFGLYILNPNSDVPRKVSTFCVPVTMSQIPREVRQALWGADPTQHAALPSRYDRFSDVFEQLWDNDQDLRQSVEEARNILVGESRSNEQTFSRIIENIEEIAGLEFDRNSRRVNFVVLSDMLQNSPTYSHYRNRWGFNEYLSSRSGDLSPMQRFTFEVYLVQSCQSIMTDRRRALQQFWEDYFEQSSADATFRLLTIDGTSCQSAGSSNSEQRPVPEVDQSGETPPVPEVENLSDTSSNSPAPPGDDVTEPEDDAPVEPPSGRELIPSSAILGDAEGGPSAAVAVPSEGALNAGDGNDTIDVAMPCPAPNVRRRPELRYPRNANGTAVLRYEIQVDDRGVPIEIELYDAEIEIERQERRFVEAGNGYISRLQFNVHADDDCSGGRSVRLSLQYQ